MDAVLRSGEDHFVRCNALCILYLYNSSWTGGEPDPVSFSFSASDPVAVSVSVEDSAAVEDDDVEGLTAFGALGAFLLINLNTYPSADCIPMSEKTNNVQ